MKLKFSLLVLSLFFLPGFNFPHNKAGDKNLITYDIKLKGISSGKEKTIGAGPDNLFTIWKSIEDSLKGFTPDEEVAIEMQFFQTDAVLRDTLPLPKIKKFPKAHLELLSNCELFSYDFPEWSSPFENQSAISAEIYTRNDPPQGKGCLKMEGTDDNEDGYICSLTKHFRHPYSDNSSVTTSLSSAADNTWIFFYAYGEDQKNDVLLLLVNEVDMIADNKQTMDYYGYKIPLDFHGWKQFAVRYSDLQPIDAISVNDSRQKLGQQGNRIQDPAKLAGIQFTLATDFPGSKASCYLDNMMIIYN